MELHSNCILITGGTAGIGQGLAERFADLGNEVIICGRRVDRLNTIHKDHPSIITKNCDLSNAAERVGLVEWVIKQHPGLNILINNAGVQLLTNLIQPIEPARVMTEIEINFIAPIHLSSLIARHFIGKSKAAIINISSGLAFSPLSFMPVYCASKAALHSVTLSLRHQLKNTAVKAFEIIPPSVDTELGHEGRSDKSQSHGGMPVHEFIEKALVSIQNDMYEAAIGQAEGLHAKRETLFDVMNR